MEQHPIVGYVKILVMGVLAYVIFMSVWASEKTQDQVLRLDADVENLESTIRALSDGLDRQQAHMDRLAGANETLLKMLASGGVRPPAVTQGGTNGGGVSDTDVPDLMGRKSDEWGWKVNAKLDATLDPSLPVGTPGRYKNFLRLDPDAPEAPEDPPNLNGVMNRPWGPEPKGFNFLVENYSTLTVLVEEYIMMRPGRRHRMQPSSFNYAPALAWRVEINEDFSEYTVFLRRDAYWHPVQTSSRDYPHLAGKHKVTAHDFKFTLDIILDPQSNCPHVRSYYKDLESYEVIDDFTYVLRWKPNTFGSLAWSLTGQLEPKFVYAYDETGKEYPKETVAQEFNEHWYDQLRLGVVGCGPYRFRKYETGKYIELERWDDWYGFKSEPRYPIKTLHYKIYNEPETQMTWLRTGEVDIGGLNSTRYREWVLEETDPKSPFKDGRITVELTPTTRYLYIAWKNTDPMFSDKRVRQALTYACDREQICKKIWLGRYVPMATSVWPWSEEADSTLKPYPFDPRKAAQLLDAAGWKMNPATGLREKVIDGKKTQFRFTLNWPGPSAEFQNMLDHYKNDLLKLGIEMTPLSTQWAQFQKDMRDRKFKAFSLLWVLSGWEHDFKQIWHSDQIKEPGSSNYIEFSNKELDALQNTLDHTMDPAERTKIIHRIGHILYEEQPYTFFGWAKIYLSHWNHVGNWENHRYYIRPLLRTFPLWIDKP